MCFEQENSEFQNVLVVSTLDPKKQLYIYINLCRSGRKSYQLLTSSPMIEFSFCFLLKMTCVKYNNCYKMCVEMYALYSEIFSQLSNRKHNDSY